jgi:hypothetical protein
MVIPVTAVPVITMPVITMAVITVTGGIGFIGYPAERDQPCPQCRTVLPPLS